MAKIGNTISFSYTGTIDGYIHVESDKALNAVEGKALIAKMAKEDPDELCNLIYQSIDVDLKSQAKAHTEQLQEDESLWEVDEVSNYDDEGKTVMP